MLRNGGVRGARLARPALAVTLAAAALVLAVLDWGPRDARFAARAQEPGALGGTRFGDPLPGLTAAQRQQFLDGKEAFEEVETADDGIGPVFNDVSCAACHNEPATGGGSSVLTTRFGRRASGRFDPLINKGGPVIQRQGILGLQGFQFQGEVVPPEANVVARRRATPVFGFGLVDAVPDSGYLALAQFQAIFTPATAGRANMVLDLRTGRTVVGKFGWKSGVANLLVFSGDAYKEEMGITTPGWVRDGDGRIIDEENAPQGDASLLRFNPVASPNEPDIEDVILFTDFMTLLAPPPRGPITAAVERGENHFLNIGCANCHVPTLRTGPNDVRALDRVNFHPYSDFLIHDMGSLGDGIEQGTGRGRDMRTQPLWGLRTQPFFLHDGRAATVEQAILGHAGQGAASRNRFRDLTRRQKDDLLAFLNSL